MLNFGPMALPKKGGAQYLVHFWFIAYTFRCDNSQFYCHLFHDLNCSHVSNVQGFLVFCWIIIFQFFFLVPWYCFSLLCRRCYNCTVFNFSHPKQTQTCAQTVASKVVCLHLVWQKNPYLHVKREFIDNKRHARIWYHFIMSETHK